MSCYSLYVSELDDDVAALVTGRSVLAEGLEFGLFIVSKSGRDVGRCAAIINSTFQAQKDPNSGFIGYFAAAEGCAEEVAALFAAAESWLKERGVVKVIAPVNGGAPQVFGFLVTDFDKSPMFPFPWTPPYYNDYITALGYTSAYPMWYYDVDFASPKFKAAKAKYGSIDTATIRTVSKKHWERDVVLFTDLLNETFINEWEFTKLSYAKVREFMKPLKDILDPRHLLLAEADGKPVGFCFAVPDLTPLFRSFKGKVGLMAIFKILTGAAKRFDRAGILTIGVVDSAKGKGIAKAIAVKVYSYHESQGLKRSFYYPVNDINSNSRGFAESIGGTGKITYQVYDKHLG